jgi:hypothetical protein
LARSGERVIPWLNHWLTNFGDADAGDDETANKKRTRGHARRAWAGTGHSHVSCLVGALAACCSVFVTIEIETPPICRQVTSVTWDSSMSHSDSESYDNSAKHNNCTPPRCLTLSSLRACDRVQIIDLMGAKLGNDPQYVTERYEGYGEKSPHDHSRV